MGTWDAASAATSGQSDVFDRAVAFVEWVEEGFVDPADIPVEWHDGSGASLAEQLFGGDAQNATAHVHDVKAILKQELAEAKKKIREAEHTAMKILAEV